MKRFHVFLLVLAMLALASLSLAQPADPAGSWSGAIELPGAELGVVVVLESADGSWSGTIDIPAQGLRGFALSDIAVGDGRVHFAMAGIPGEPTFDGALSATGDAIGGTFTQGPQSFPFTLRRTPADSEPTALARPQHPQPPFPYQSRDVAFRNEAAGIRLAGTLVVPPGDGPFPAVVLVTGSGPQDRDETLFGHKPFLVLADHLARRGVASLRYDDRGFGASEGDHMGSTVADFAADAAAALAFLAAQPKIDRDALGILGHSEGGLAAPRVAAGNAEVGFLVLLAPPGERLDALVLRQGRDTFRQRGIEDALIDRAMAIETENLALLADESRTAAALQETLRARAALRGERFSPAELALLGIDDAAVEAGISLSTTAWFRSLLREDPAVHLKAVKVPVLALFGENDVQVAAEVNAPLVEAALAAAGNEDFEVRVLPGLNHLFQHSASGAVAEYGLIEETFAPEALDIVGDWIDERFGGERAAPEGPATASSGAQGLD